jgi:hypothetical protein
MSEIQSTTKRTTPIRAFLLVGIALILAGAFALYAGMFMNRPGTASEHGHEALTSISAKALEEQYGLRVTLIGVTAGGGMVDFRFKVIDAEKAKALLDHHENMPQLIPVGSQVRLGIPGAHSPSYADGKVYYMLYGNAGGIVRPGMPVQVAFGDVVLEPVVAQ